MSKIEAAQANMKAAFQTDPLARGMIIGAVSTIQKLTEMGILPSMGTPDQDNKEAQNDLP